jgi:FkbM family methyltransferase
MESRAVSEQRLAEPDEDAVAPATRIVAWRGHSFTVLRHGVVEEALGMFCSDFEAGTQRFFDAVLPGCEAMIDVGAHVGLTTLYAAGRVGRVVAFEPSPVNFAVLRRNVALNPELSARISLFAEGLSDRDERVPLYAKAYGDSGSSIFQDVERARVVRGAAVATVALRHAPTVLREIGLSGRALIKIDIEGAEYQVVPAIADLLEETKPFLHLSFHPFNLLAGPDEYATTLLRLRRSLDIASALAHYRFMYFYAGGKWICLERAGRMDFLRQYLLRPKPVARVGTPQYGFIDAVAFTDAQVMGL